MIKRYKSNILFRVHSGWFMTVLMVLLSLGSYLFYSDGNFGQFLDFSSYDSGDYRYVAEKFWHVSYDPATYSFTSNWFRYMDIIPFRGIFAGSYYLLLHQCVFWINPQWAGSPPVMGIIYASITKMFWVVGYLFLYGACKPLLGGKMSLMCILALIFPTSLWGLTQDIHLSEALLRICFLLLLTLFLRYEMKLWSPWICISIVILLIICSQIKSQWVFLGVCTGFAWIIKYKGKRYSVLMGASMMFMPLLSVLLINGLAWADFTLTPGAGMHANFKTHGQYIEYLCNKREPETAIFCNKSSDIIGWWNVYGGMDVPPESYRALDNHVLGYYLESPKTMVDDFANGLKNASHYPQSAPILRLLDIFTWCALLLGLFKRRTILISSFGLALWVGPAIANMFSEFGPRYYAVMSAIPLVVACVVIFQTPYKWGNYIRYKRMS